MSMQTITFENFAPRVHDVYNIGATEHGLGVIPEMAMAFGHELAPEPNPGNLGDLIKVVGQSKELQQNLPRVQEVLGTDQKAVDIARNWVERSGLLVPTERSFMDPNLPLPKTEKDAVLFLSGGVRNWMRRRADVALALKERGIVKNAIIAVGNRAMKGVEGPDVRDGMTEADYMDEVIVPILEEADVVTDILRVESSNGSEVMAVGAEHIFEHTNAEPIIVVGNAGAGIQMAGQLRQAFRSVEERHTYSFDPDGSELFIATDGFPLGETGKEPTSTHQNPFTALGQIARNAKILTEVL